MRHTVNSLWIGTLSAFTIHNVEEVIAFSSGWPARHVPGLGWTVSYWPGFAIAAAALTLSAVLVAFALRHRPRASSKLLKLFLWVMLGNVLWHIGVSVYVGSVAPGAVTAVLVLLPLYSFYLSRLSKIDHASTA